MLAGALVAGSGLIGIHASMGIAQAADSGTCPTPAASYAGGNGTGGDPFRIETPAQLQRLRDTSADWTDAVTLTADIDMGGCVWGTTLGDIRVDGNGWRGVFDGDGHTVSGLDISLSGTSYGGLFAYLGTGGDITGVGFTGDVSVTLTAVSNGTTYAGGLVGFTLGGPISNSFATGDVTATTTVSANPGANASAYVGGLVGYSQGSISDSYATGAVSGTAEAVASGFGSASALLYIGGLIGTKAVNTVADSYSTGALSAAASATGGSGQSTNSIVGGFIGQRSDAALNTVWNTTTSGTMTGVGTGGSTGVTGVTSEQMRDFATFGPAGQNWGITDGYSAATTWSMCPYYNSGFPFLSAFVPSSVCDPPPVPPIVVPAGPPQSVEAAAGDGAATVSWTAPESSGSFPVSTYQVQGAPSGQCLVPAASLSCEVTGLRNGVEYSLRVRALTGAGWGAWSSPVVVTPVAETVRITGTRTDRQVEVTGLSTVPDAAEGQVWMRTRAWGEFRPVRPVATVAEDGSLEWRKRLKRDVPVRVYVVVGGVDSNRITLR